MVHSNDVGFLSECRFMWMASRLSSEKFLLQMVHLWYCATVITFVAAALADDIDIGIDCEEAAASAAAAICLFC